MARTDWPIVWEILVRDKLVCVYCGLDGKQSFQSWCQLLHGVDHLVPASSLNAEAYQITRDNMGNLVTSCWICNRAKGTFNPTRADPINIKSAADAPNSEEWRKELILRSRRYLESNHWGYYRPDYEEMMGELADRQ